MDKITICLADNIEFMKGFKKHYFDLVIADPWYGIGMNKNMSAFAKRRFKTANSIEDNRPPLEYFSELFRVGKEVIIWGGNYMLDLIAESGQNPNCRAPIIWNKGTGANYFADGELAWTSFKSGCLRIVPIQWCGCFKGAETGIKTIHPCQKPVELYEWIYKNYTKSGYKVLDPNMGSGSSAIAAKNINVNYNHHLHYFSCDHDINYYHKAEKRIAKHKVQRELMLTEESINENN